jgi:hypothetical protein
MLAAPAQAQRTKSESAKRSAREAIIRDPIKLAEVCNALVFRKYAKPGPRYGAKYVEMDLELHARMQNACIMSKGRSY